MNSSSKTQKIPPPLMSLPRELRDIIVTYCSYAECKALLLIPTTWADSVLEHSNKRIKDYYLPSDASISSTWSLDKPPLFMLEAWALNKEPRGKMCYDELKIIDKANFDDISDKQKAFEKAALKSPEHARLILFNTQWWESLHKNEIERAAFIFKVAGKWPEAMYDALDNDDLRNQWLPVMLKFQKDCRYFFKAGNKGFLSTILYKTLFGATRFQNFMEEQSYGGRHFMYGYEEIRDANKAFLSLVNALAWLWSTKPALLNLLIERAETKYFDDYIDSIIESSNKHVLRLWVTQPVLLNLLKKCANSKEFFHKIFTEYPDSTKEATEITQLLLSNEVLYTVLAHPSMQDILTQCINKIIKNIDQELAKLWATPSTLHNLMMQMPEQDRRNCLKNLIKVGGEEVKDALQQSTVKNDVESLNGGFLRFLPWLK